MLAVQKKNGGFQFRRGLGLRDSARDGLYFSHNCQET